MLLFLVCGALQELKLVYSCRANRNRKDIASMVGLTNVQLVMCSYRCVTAVQTQTRTHAFF